MEMTVLLRELTDNDLELVLAWRSNPEVFSAFYQQGHLGKGAPTWEGHYRWWHSRYNWKRWIIQVNDGETTRDVGQVTFAQLDNWNPEVGILIGEVTLWGKGVGKKALSLALDWLRNKGYEKVHTTILKGNERAIRLHESVGFKRTGEARKMEWAYELSWIPSE